MDDAYLSPVVSRLWYGSELLGTRVLYSGRVIKVGKKDRQGQVGLLGDWLLQWKKSCPEGHQKSGSKVLMSGTCT